MRTVLCLLSLLLLLSTMLEATLGPAAPVQARPIAPKVMVQTDPNCDPELDLSGELLTDSSARVHNSSATCSYPVGLAVYRMIDGSLANQELADWQTEQIGPGETLSLQVTLPDCSAQINLFYGPLIISFADERYGERKLATQILPGNGHCRPEVPSCVAFAVAQGGDKRAHLVAVDPRAQRLISLGELPAGIRGLALHPESGLLYAAAGIGADQPGMLLTLDRDNAKPTNVGSTGFANLGALAFRNDNTLWGWAGGLVQIDPLSGAASQVFAASEDIRGLVWSLDGTTLYAIKGTTIYSYRPGEAGLQLLGRGLPSVAQAVSLRPDGLLLIASGAADGIRLHSVDPQTRKATATIAISSDFHKLRALAWPQGCGNPSRGGDAPIITRVTFDRDRICSGEDVLVTVSTSHPESPNGRVDVAINGQWGAERYLRFSGEPGPRLIRIIAVTPEKHIDSAGHSVEIIACDPAPATLDIGLRINPFHQHAVDFEVLNHAALAVAGASYSWEFGDGQGVQTSLPYAMHDYGSALDRDAAYTSFSARVTLRRSGQPDLVAHKTVTVWNQYALAKERGYLQPAIQAPTRLPSDGNVAIKVHNREDAPLTFVNRSLELQYCDATRDPLALPVETISYVVPAASSALYSFAAPGVVQAADVCGLAVTLEGVGPNAMPAFVNAYVEVRANPQRIARVSDPALLALLNRVTRDGLVSNPLAVSDADLYRLAREQRIQYPIPPGGTIGGPRTLTAEMQAGAPAAADHLGEICVVGSPPPRPGLVCSPSGEWDWVPPRIANAYKGDTILSAGCSMIGDLLRQVSPPQRYTHAGLMVENYYSIRHSTASVDRYRDKDYGEGTPSHSDGIRADILQYGWPGIITQSVYDAYNGDWLRDPVNGKLYKVSGFSADPVQCSRNMSLSYPLVVRPVPGARQSVRATLHQAANLAQGMQGHYRFFAYTNAVISTDRSYDAPNSLNWDGVYPRLATVCSSFIWTAMREAGAVLEGATLEEADMRQGAERDGATPDGLYLYTQAERLAGANWLYENVFNEAKEEAGWFGNFITDAADDIANQLVNCFASDRCSEKDDQPWKQPGVGRAISPDNILFWDTPAQGGVYGYSEPLVYRPAEFVQLARWVPAPNVGTISGRVLFEGNPVAGVTVKGITGLELDTDAAGRFRDELVPAGTYTLVATVTRNGLTLETTAQVTIFAGQTTTIDLVLQPLPDYYREVLIQGSMVIVDTEDIFPDEEDKFPIDERRLLNPTTRTAEIRIQNCVGGEVRIELDINLQIQNDNRSVRATGEARMYEGMACSDDDLDDRKTFAHVIAPGGAQSVAIFLKNQETMGKDKAYIDFQVINATQPRQIVTVATPEAGGTLSTPDGELELKVPAGAVEKPVSISYTALTQPGHALPAGTTALHSFSLTATDKAGAPVTELAQPAVLTLNSNKLAGVNAANLQLAYWNGTRWVILTGSTNSLAAETFSVTVRNFGKFVVLHNDSNRIYLPLVVR